MAPRSPRPGGELAAFDFDFDGRRYTVTIELDYLPDEGGRRFAARRIIVEMLNEPLRADDWRKILPIPLIHEATRNYWAAVLQGEPMNTLVFDGQGEPRDATPEEAASLARSRQRARDAFASTTTPGGNRDASSPARRRELVAQLHAEALERGVPTPRQYVIDGLQAEGIVVSAATATRDIRAATRRGTSRANPAPGGSS